MQIRGTYSTIPSQLHGHVINKFSAWMLVLYKAHYWLHPPTPFKKKKNPTVPATVSRVFRPQLPSSRSALMSTSLLCKSTGPIDPLHVRISHNKHLHKWSRVEKVEGVASGGQEVGGGGERIKETGDKSFLEAVLFRTKQYTIKIFHTQLSCMYIYRDFYHISGKYKIVLRNIHT